jgi:O-acetylhomoserine/O-acetylserine sulfhydrylase-like pyridoxal-dependent enzyme
MEKIIALTTTVNGRTNYVAHHIRTRAADNKKIVDYTTDPEKAHDFQTQDAALAFIETIVNPHERVFSVLEVEVPEKKNALTPMGEELI